MTKTQMLFLTIRCRHHSGQVMTKVLSQHRFVNTVVLRLLLPHQVLARDLARPRPNPCPQTKWDANLSHMRSFSSCR
jgi:hypothetical protein